MSNTHRSFFKRFIILIGCMLLLTACGPKEEALQPSPSGGGGQAYLSGAEGTGLSFLSDGGREGMDIAVESSAF